MITYPHCQHCDEFCPEEQAGQEHTIPCDECQAEATDD
jgi:hypothetical protein